MQAGTLRNIIRIERRPDTRDELGQRSDEWVVVRQDWADVKDLDGVELLNAQLLTAQVTGRIYMRGFKGWRTVLLPDMRVLFADRVFDIKAIFNTDGLDRELTLFISEIVA